MWIRIMQNKSQATDKLKASCEKDWKSIVGSKMCDLTAVIMKEVQTDKFFWLKNRKNQEVSIRYT